MENIKYILNNQRNYYFKGKPKDVDFRIEMLRRLKNAIVRHENDITDALWEDLRKSSFEAYATEIGLVLEEIDLAIKNTRKWSKPVKKRTPMMHFLSSSYVYPEPYGVVLIISPWNYPFQLAIAPLAGAIAAGNCAMIKPSKYSKATSKVICTIVEECFEKDYVSVVEPEGGREAIGAILEEKFDYIFFTGSASTGRVIMQSAAKNLTPVTLELGGKSPCIVDKDADINLAARRIVWGKLLNAGQTCVAPDYLFVHESVKNQLIEKIKFYIEEMYGKNPKDSKEYPRIINTKQFDRLVSYLNAGKIIVGGDYDREELYIEPTIIDSVSKDYPVMKEEIFGPIFPLMEFDKIDEVINFVNSRPKPLALYYFSNDKASQEKVLKNTSSGGGCINDTIIHVASHHISFGGVGDSGMGAYHGKASFDTFSHMKGIIKKSNKIDIKFRYAPYKNRLNLLKKIM